MVPRVLIDTASIPGVEGSLRLFQRGAEFSIMLGSNELMNSRLSGSEEALATLACEKISRQTAPHLLIGGLGMGFTLRAALNVLGKEAVISVAELVPAVVAWARGPMHAVHAGSLTDRRVKIIETDVTQLIGQDAERYDAILLDVDNGPDGLTRASNDRLYSTTGLRAAWVALRPGGVLAIWSSAPDKAFTDRLMATGFHVEQVEVRAHRGKSGARHTIWLAARSVT
jgi:spermidine synthase